MRLVVYLSYLIVIIAYVQAPYTDCSKEEYEALKKITPQEIDWTSFLEEDDFTEGSQTLACTGGSCEI
jgi:carbamate kinase